MIAFASLLSLFLVLAGAITFRLGLLPFGISFSTFGLGLVACAILAITTGALIFRRLARKQPVGKLPLWLILCSLPVVLVFKQVGLAGFQAPPIHDISTDLLHPPVFVFAQAKRGSGDNSLVHGGEALAEQQRQGYPQLAPLHLSASKAEVWAGAKTLIAKNKWHVLGEDKSRGHIEAAAITPLMAFTDDIVIRISVETVADKAVVNKNVTSRTEKEQVPIAEKVIVDVRSVSRVGVSDLGANAARIDAFLHELKDLLNK
ncbi:MAG: DUF1499 domain-containing protein [Gammaproteobacteria bacterium]|nr:DUF1499 domain-containing protein [Gammaproteobacteria bacterium]MBQ0840447.1 DUF1499 domain-containing protein [Gammaproteobacteria bacterium]